MFFIINYVLYIKYISIVLQVFQTICSFIHSIYLCQCNLFVANRYIQLISFVTRPILLISTCFPYLRFARSKICKIYVYRLWICIFPLIWFLCLFYRSHHSGFSFLMLILNDSSQRNHSFCISGRYFVLFIKLLFFWKVWRE